MAFTAGQITDIEARIRNGFDVMRTENLFSPAQVDAIAAQIQAIFTVQTGAMRSEIIREVEAQKVKVEEFYAKVQTLAASTEGIRDSLQLQLGEIKSHLDAATLSRGTA